MSKPEQAMHFPLKERFEARICRIRPDRQRLALASWQI
jgi:hypothetical protein